MNERYTFTPTIVRDLIAAWLDDGWLEVADAARKTRRAKRIGTLRVTAE